MYQIFDVTKWERKQAFDFFQTFADPYVDVTVEVEVGKLFAYCKEAKLGFSYAVVWHILRVCNQIDNFRMRWVDGEMRLYDRVHAGNTLAHDNHTYTHCYFEYDDEMTTFCRKSKAHAQERLQYVGEHDPQSEGLDVIHMSFVPKMRFLHAKNPHRNAHDYFPKIIIGKATPQGDGRYLMPISLSVHHAVMDGFHLSLFYEKLQAQFDSQEV